MDVKRKQKFSSIKALINSGGSGSVDNSAAGDSDTRPTKKFKVESPPLPIPAVPLSSLAMAMVPVRRARSLRGPQIPKFPTLGKVVPPPPSPAPKRNAIAVGAECNGIVSQKIPAVGRGVPSSSSPAPAPPIGKVAAMETEEKRHRQFWKAGDYEGAPTSDGNWESCAGGSDHIRVHPRFLHSNATSHRWALGAFAELLDNSLDEVGNGATFVNIDMIESKESGDRMLVIEDNGGGMDPTKMRQCMSLGYSAKGKLADKIGQYGNGFKTSTMRLGADVIVFSRFGGENGNRSTQSIGLLSYTYLRCSLKQDIEVPMLDYERKGQVWERIVRPTSSAADWNQKVDTIVQWSPFSSEADLLEQLDGIKDHGTRIFIYNLWEDDQGELELDFDTDPHDIQIRGANRDEKNIEMAQRHPNSKHFLTYRHSLRSYASILYLRIPQEFQMILRGKNIEHHNIVNDMMMSQRVSYRPQYNRVDGVTKDSKMAAEVTVGFVKDAKAHIDVQGFNVYHKNRLIKPFWRVWHPPGSDGRGVIGVLEANFVEPAHDKQGFERTLVLSRLEGKLVQMQRTYWLSHCHEIGYAPRKKSKNETADQPASQAPNSETFTELNVLDPVSGNNVSPSPKSQNKNQNGRTRIGSLNIEKRNVKPINKSNGPSIIVEKDCGNSHSQKSSPSKRAEEEDSSEEVRPSPVRMSRSDDQRPTMRNTIQQKSHSHMPLQSSKIPVLVHKGPTAEEKNGGKADAIRRNVDSKRDKIGQGSSQSQSQSQSIEELSEENRALKERLKMKEREFLGDLLRDLKVERDNRKLLETQVDKEKNRCKSLETQLQEATTKIEELNKELETQLQEATTKIEELNKEQDALLDIFSDERNRHESEEEKLRKELKDALNSIQQLRDK